MRFLVDANVLSEPTKPAPAAIVTEWLRHNERELAVDPIILGEIRFGIHLLSAGKPRQRLEDWFAAGVSRIQCLVWDAAVGLRWAKLLADLRRRGQALPIKDSLVAATAPLQKGLDTPRGYTCCSAFPPPYGHAGRRICLTADGKRRATSAGNRPVPSTDE